MSGEGAAVARVQGERAVGRERRTRTHNATNAAAVAHAAEIFFISILDVSFDRDSSVFCTDGSRCRGSPISSASAFGSPAGCRISQPFPRAHGRMSADIRTGGTPIRWMGGVGRSFGRATPALYGIHGPGKGRDVGESSNIPPVASLMPYGGSERSSDHLAACTPCLTVEVLRRAPKRVTPTPPKAMMDSRTPPMAMPVLARSSR